MLEIGPNLKIGPRIHVGNGLDGASDPVRTMLGRSFLYGSHPFAEQFDSGSTRGEEERHMNFRLSRSMALRTILVVWVLIATAFAFMVTSQNAAAAARTNLVIGLENDMVNLNPFDPGTNSVWKAYQTQYNFESLFTYDPNYQIYADLADPAAACPTGTTAAVPGSCVDTSKLNITVNIRSGVTFTNGQTLTADDVVFTYQTLPWSTLATDIVQAIWWDHPVAPLWNSTANGATGAGACPSSNPKCSSHLGIFKTGPLQVRFQLTPHTVPGVTNGGYALVFYDTLVSAIIPSGIWKNHLQSTPQINYSDPALGNIKDSVDQSIDFSFGGPGQYDATVGTGPFYMTSWTRNAGSKSLVYGNYWGKSVAHTWAGPSYPFPPPSDGKHVTEFDFIVFGSLDVVSLALQQGTIDTLLWSLTPGFVNVVGSNPAITVQTVTDSGYFYLSFNTRVAPWSDLCLRQAISMAIDKNYIVNTLMGGYGIPGYAPISIANPTYVNSSATPQVTYNQAGIGTKLQSCGYTIDPATGFYRTPSGQPITATILTPPKDYDPVRADAGIMISNNLKAAHLNIDAAPTRFDTIVAQSFTPPVDYDIYILGFLLGDFPESYLCNFFCSYEDPNIDPAGGNSAGYNNPVVDALIKKALVTVDNQARYKLVKDVESIVVRDLPWNVLFYRKNLNAYRNDAWVGWVNTPPQLYNYWSLVNLAPAGLVTPPIPPTTGVFSVAMTVPGRVRFGATVPVDVIVANANVPVSGASVTLKAVFGNNSQTLTGATDSGGHAGISWEGPIEHGEVLLPETAAHGTATM